MKKGTKARWRWVLCGLSLWLAAACDNPRGYDKGRCDGEVNAAIELEKPAGSLRLMTANMWGIPYWSHDVDARFEAMAKRLNDDLSLDVVAFEEVWDNSARTKMLALVAEQYPYRADFHGQHRRSGLALISRRPFIGEPQFLGYDETGKWWKPWTGEWFGGKGAGAVQIQTEHGPLWIFVTHLHACYGTSAVEAEQDDEYASYRQHQVEALRAMVDRLAGDAPAVVLGDFNFTARSRYCGYVTAAGKESRFAPGWQLIGEPNAPRGRIDHIWLRPGRAASWRSVDSAGSIFTEPVELADGRQVGLSDHCPIVATIAPMAAANGSGVELANTPGSP